VNAKSRYSPAIPVSLSLVAGAALAVALPPRGVWMLGWIAFLPLLAAARITRPIIAAGCGLITGITCACVFAGQLLNGAQLVNLGGAFGAFAVVLAFAAGLASAGARRLSVSVWAVFVACAGVSAELLSVYVFPVNVALSQHQNAFALWLAAYTGIWGVSFLIWLVPGSLIAVISEPKRGWALFAVGAAAALAGLFVEFPEDLGSSVLHVAAVQAPDPCSAAEETGRIAHRADIVVWPEHLMHRNLTLARETASKNKVYLVASFVGHGGGKKLFNSACIIGPDGSTAATSRKQHLFGSEAFEYTTGQDSNPARCRGFSPGVPICFDTMFTDVTRGLVRRGADILLVPNHDPMMPRYVFHHLHSAAIPFRAAENGVPIVWSECSGLSAIYDRHGRRTECAPEGQVTSVRAWVVLRSGKTLFTRAGEYFAYACAFAVVVTAGVLIRRRKSLPC